MRIPLKQDPEHKTGKRFVEMLQIGTNLASNVIKTPFDWSLQTMMVMVLICGAAKDVIT